MGGYGDFSSHLSFLNIIVFYCFPEQTVFAGGLHSTRGVPLQVPGSGREETCRQRMCGQEGGSAFRWSLEVRLGILVWPGLSPSTWTLAGNSPLSEECYTFSKGRGKERAPLYSGWGPLSSESPTEFLNSKTICRLFSYSQKWRGE